MFFSQKYLFDSEASKTFDFNNKQLQYNQINWTSSLSDSDYSKIQDLSLYFNENNLGNSCVELVKDLEKFQILRVLDLNLAQNKISDQSFIDICTSIFKIQSLKKVYLAFWENSITDDGIKKSIQFIVQSKNLEGFCLYLGKNQIKDAGLQIISENIIHLKNIKDLQLSLWGNGLTDIAFRTFSENLSSFPNIIHLYLDFLYHQNVTDKTATLLGKSLANLKYLRALQINFQDTGITKEGEQNLANLISQISQIVCLRYYYSQKNVSFKDFLVSEKKTLKFFKKRSRYLIFAEVNSIKKLIN
ncbi:hypothetical protein ABPG72_022410 [Tetrahymena utriculariae]